MVTFSVLIFVIWSAGMVTAHTLGGLIHLFLILALIELLAENSNGTDRREMTRRKK
jgi:hypothetical protein